MKNDNGYCVDVKSTGKPASRIRIAGKPCTGNGSEILTGKNVKDTSGIKKKFR